MLRKINITNAGILLLIQVNLFVFCHKPPGAIQLWTTPVPEVAKTAAVYGEIRNPFASSVEIQTIVSENYQSVEFHETTIDETSQIARMRKVEYPIPLQATETILLTRSGKHLMLYDKLKQSGDLKLEIHFSNGEKRTVVVEKKTL
ncbi:copper chaperone PCu(A)C [Leptospira kanakyensis]|uniref:copper chaperone PCu(A)C n=1 Tax=Leptospira kanakyensis TaxID=2484968 RepID=UPI001FC9216E|nr:copper chaperone PCu(A)C [Leptospira kanakyensis]MCW7470132.1 copper chaperone PCu(A)C [Leptospira kanakyensis]MCW7481112.1 copper chaperone PCu(A)C [Leptospira kanakyensis]